MQPSAQPLLATCATSNRAAVGSCIGGVRRPRPALSAHGRQAADRAGLASAGRSADAPACGQAVAANLARTKLDLGRRRWRGGSSERMNGQAKDLSDRNTFFTCDTVNADQELRKNVRLYPGMSAYVRVCSLNGRKMFEGAAP